MQDQDALTRHTIKSLQPALKEELKTLLTPHQDDLLLVVIGTFDEKDEVIEVDVSSPITLEDYQTGGYMEIYHTVGAVKALLQ